MKLRPAAWWTLLLATHAAVFLVARPAASPASTAVGAGEAAAAAAGQATAKVNDRGRDNRSAKPASVQAGLLAELDASDLEGEEYREAQVAIFREWIKRDLRGALGAIYGPEAGARYSDIPRALYGELTRELAAQSGQVVQWIRGGYFGSRHAEVAGRWAEALIQAGLRELAVAALPDLPGKSRAEVIDELCETAKGPELAALRQWMEPGSQDKLDEFAKRVVRFAGDDPEKIFGGEQEEAVIKALSDAYKERHIAGLPPREAVAACLKLPESHRLDAFGEIARADGVEGFTTVMAEMDRLSLWEEISGEQEEEFISSAIQSVCDSYSLPDDVFRELSRISRPETRFVALRKAAAEMGSQARADAVAEVIATLPRGAELDAFILGLAPEDVDITSDVWPRVLECVSDPGLKAVLGEVRKGGGGENDSVVEEEEGG